MEKSGIIITWISNKWKWGVEGEVFSMENCKILGVEVKITKMCMGVNFENLLLICYNFRVSILII